MTGYRLSIAGMLWGVAVVALWIYTLRASSGVGVAAAATSTLAVLLSSVLAAVYLRGPDRAFWVGFALFGWCYFLFVNWDWVGGPIGHDLTEGLRDLAEALIPAVPDPYAGNPFRATPPRPVSGGARASVSAALAGFPEDYQQREIRIGRFVETGRMTLSLLFGFVGGVIARRLAATRDDPPTPAAGTRHGGGPAAS